MPAKTPDIRWVDPRELRVLPSSYGGADPWKLHRQIARFGSSATGIPPLLVAEAADGVFVVYDGVTRATRIAKFVPGTLVPVEVIARLKGRFAADPKIGDLLP
jgi:hypothetical protein